jgi:Ca-activated chloride channel family protein
MNRKFAFLTILILLATLLTPISALADGIIVPDPCRDCPVPPPPMTQLAVKYHRVTVTINDQIATTHVDQVFYNPNDWQVEGTYIFPLPLDAAVSSFTLWVDGKPVEAKILGAEQARQTYQQIVNSMRDPALLEYAGRGAVQAHIFPIPPQGERRVELEYTQALTAENGLVQYIYPLSTEKFSVLPLEQVSISVDIDSNVPIRAVYSPSHAVDVQRQSDKNVTASYEESNVLPQDDFALYFSLGETEAFHLLSYRNPNDIEDPDGFFLVLLAPRPEVDAKPLAKDIILVLDRSGSMEGEKFTQAQEAARYILGHLNPDDKFDLIAFNSSLDSYATRLRPASEAEDAISWINNLSALGSTDIDRALQEAASIANTERPTYLIFLTDGLPTEGVTDSDQILRDFTSVSKPNLRLFVFGVGYDVDTYLLDLLAQEHHGLSFYVQPGERLDEALSTFYSRISTPVLTNLELDFEDISTYDMYPSPLPDLFLGSQIIAVGRYRQGGSTDITLTGMVNDSNQKFKFSDEQFATHSASNDPLAATLPRLWATRKIGYLLNQVRLHGADQETIDQIVRISIRYGIVTPYTSYLVTEDMPLGVEERDVIVEREMLLQATAAPASGAQAVQKAADQGFMVAAEAPVEAAPESVGKVRSVGARTFILKNSTWIDTAYDPQTMQTTKIAFLSPDYFTLVNTYPDLAAAFALGTSVIAISGNDVYEVVDEGSKVESLDLQSLATQPVETPQKLQSNQIDTGSTETPQADQATPTAGSSATSPCAAGLLPLVFIMIGLFTILVKNTVRKS